MKPHHFKYFVLLFTLFMLEACEPPEPGSWKNDQMPSGKRGTFHDMNAQAFDDLKANNPKHLGLLLSREMLGLNNSRLVEMISNQLNDNAFDLLEEYYVVNKYNDTDTIPGNTSDINKHDLIYGARTQEMYFAFFVPKNKSIPNRYMISVEYCYFSYGWKINDLQVSQYTVNGKTAPELYKLAKEKYAKGHLIDAEQTMELATFCLNPGSIWRYTDENEIAAFSHKTVQDANDHFKFPFMLNMVSTRPQIIRVYNQTTPKGTFPTVYYLSRISLKDTTAIKRENTEIEKVIGQVMPGIDKDKKYLMYSVFNQRPGLRRSVDHFDITETLP